MGTIKSIIVTFGFGHFNFSESKPDKASGTGTALLFVYAKNLLWTQCFSL